MIYYAIIEKNIITGYYTKEIHKNIPKNSIPITDELWQHLLNHNKTLVDLEGLSSTPSIIDKDNPLTIDYKYLFLVDDSSFETKEYVSKEKSELNELKNKIRELENMILNLTQIK